MLEKDWIDKNSGFSVRKYISDDSRSPLFELVFICQQKHTPVSDDSLFGRTSANWKYPAETRYRCSLPFTQDNTKDDPWESGTIALTYRYAGNNSSNAPICTLDKSDS